MLSMCGYTNWVGLLSKFAVRVAVVIVCLQLIAMFVNHAIFLLLHPQLLNPFQTAKIAAATPQTFTIFINHLFLNFLDWQIFLRLAQNVVVLAGTWGRHQWILLLVSLLDLGHNTARDHLDPTTSSCHDTRILLASISLACLISSRIISRLMPILKRIVLSSTIKLVIIRIFFLIFFLIGGRRI